MENVEFNYVGFWKRLVAYIIDSILLMLVLAPITYLLMGDMSPQAMNDPVMVDGMLASIGLLPMVLLYVLPIALIIGFWAYKQATPGKMLFSAKIVDAKTGEKPDTMQCVVRYIGYIISTIPLCLGFLWIAFDAKKQGWHDKISGTVVIKD